MIRLMRYACSLEKTVIKSGRREKRKKNKPNFLNLEKYTITLTL